MKSLSLVFLPVLAILALGLAAPSNYELKHSKDQFDLQNFKDALWNDPLELESSENEFDPTEIFDSDVEEKKTLKEKFLEFVKKVKGGYENAKLALDLFEKFEKLRDVLKEFGIDLNDYLKEYLTGKAKEIFENFMKDDKETKKTSKRDIDDKELIAEMMSSMRDQFDPRALRVYLEKIAGKDSEMLEQLNRMLREPGREKRKQRIMEWLEQIFGDKRRSVQGDQPSEQKKTLKEKYLEFVKKVKGGYEKAKLALDVFEKFEKLSDVLKEFGIDLNDYLEEYLTGKLKKIFENFMKDDKETKKTSKRAIEDKELIAKMMMAAMREQFDPRDLRVSLEKIAGKDSEMMGQLDRMLREPGRENRKKRIMEWLEQNFGNKRRAVQDDSQGNTQQ